MEMCYCGLTQTSHGPSEQNITPKHYFTLLYFALFLLFLCFYFVFFLVVFLTWQLFKVVNLNLLLPMSPVQPYCHIAMNKLIIYTIKMCSITRICAHVLNVFLK